MANKEAEKESLNNSKKKLGKLISKCRGDKMSQSQLAKRVGLARSNMKYIEDGVNAPTADIYKRIIEELLPSPKRKAEMDRLFTKIRRVPPPDVCDVLLNNIQLMNSIQSLYGIQITDDQSKKISALIESFKENNRGDTADE